VKKIKSDAIGIGLRVPHYRFIQENLPEIDFFEIISENFMTDAQAPLNNISKISAHYPIALHGVSINLLGRDPIDDEYFVQLKKLADLTQAPYFTDHLCWTSIHGIGQHDLLPTPYTEDMIEWAVSRAKMIQNKIGLPFGIENLSAYVDFSQSEMTEWKFYNEVVKRSGTHYMLDLNNIYVSSINQGFDPYEYLESIDFSKVLQVHLAGHTERDDGTIIDTHDKPVCDEVWKLYSRAWEIGGPFPTLLEWDDNIPNFEEVRSEALKARLYRSNNKGV
jgi:uncharacterized protein